MPSLLIAAASGTYHQLARLQSMTQWWQWLLLVVLVIAVAAYVVVMYRKDAVELRPGIAAALLVLRLTAFLGILFFFFDLERRTERRVVKDSRLLLLVDTSQSMGLPNQPRAGAAGPSRMDEVVRELSQGDLLQQFRKLHEVVVYHFDQQARPAEIATFPKLITTGNQTTADRDEAEALQGRSAARLLAYVAAGLFVFSLISGALAWLGLGRSREGENSSWTALAGAVTLIAALIVLGVALLRSPQLDLLAAIGLRQPAADGADAGRSGSGGTGDSAAANSAAGATGTPGSVPQVDWRAELLPRGTETHLGDAVDFLVNKERGGPVAGIVLMTDGVASRTDLPYESAAATAQDAGIPIFAVGLGSDQRPLNVRVVDLEAPQRVYPGDKFTLTGLVQGFGVENRSVKVELLSSNSAADASAPGTVEEERRVQLGRDGDILPLKFEATPNQPGQITYKLRVSLAEPDADPKDNEKVARVQVVERKNRVLLIAGGPSREYQFLKNLLYRDKDTTLDVWLQSGVEGISQEAHDLLFDFPETADELFDYDAIIAFDPDWEAFDEDQVKLLERWVAEEAGGLMVVAGPVFTPQWSARRPGDVVADTVKGLYPVAFFYQGAATLSLGRFGGDKPWPLQFSRDGLDAEFLWLGESASDSEQAWSQFEGVFGYYAVKDPKPGARIYARFGDPDTAIDGTLPIYLAGHFYGAGRVFFQASGEMWRVRAVDDNYFDQYYTKLVRWISQGRLSRDSRRGVLMVDKDRALMGDQVAVRAILKDAQLRPLTVDEVPAILVSPDGKRSPIKLGKMKDATREGMYSGEFITLLEGDYRLELKPPGSGDEDLLVREVRVRVPAMEIEKPERNDPLLRDLAEKTGGEYFVGFEAANNRSGDGRSLIQAVEPQDQVTFLPGTPDRRFERALMGWLMALLCGVLSLEWLIRRLSRLA